MTMSKEELLKNTVPEDYVFEDRTVVPLGLLTLYPSQTPSLIKVYEMQKGAPPKPVDDELRSGLKQYLEHQIFKNKIDPQSHFGFTILSDGFLNVNFWGQTSVIFPNLYVIEGSGKQRKKKWKKVSIEEYGSECTWEGKIKSHEIDAWADFLKSSRDIGDLDRYLSSFMNQGLLFAEGTTTINKSELKELQTKSKEYDELVNRLQKMNILV